MQQLAIASVLPQSWKPPLQPVQALKTGTVFQELNLPFYLAEDNRDTPAKCSCELEPYARRFILYDCMLYLDTHPADPEALAFYEQLNGQPYVPWKEAALPWEGGHA